MDKYAEQTTELLTQKLIFLDKKIEQLFKQIEFLKKLVISQQDFINENIK